MKTATPTLAEQFNYAWYDLRERIDNGIDRLRDMRPADTSTPDDVDLHARLTRKASGLEETALLWREVNKRHPEDKAAAWREFTAEVVALYRGRLNLTAQEGIALALSYQRGYSPDVDAPPIFVLIPEINKK